MPEEVRLTADTTLLMMALEVIEHIDSDIVEDFLRTTPYCLLVDCEMINGCCLTSPSRVLLEFIRQCEELGLVDA